VTGGWLLKVSFSAAVCYDTPVPKAGFVIDQTALTGDTGNDGPIGDGLDTRA
jgi:hypothetical protein